MPVSLTFYSIEEKKPEHGDFVFFIKTDLNIDLGFAEVEVDDSGQILFLDDEYSDGYVPDENTLWCTETDLIYMS